MGRDQSGRWGGGGTNYDDGRPVTITDTAPRVCSAEFTVGRECMSYCKFLTSSPRLRAVNLAPPPSPTLTDSGAQNAAGARTGAGAERGQHCFFGGVF